MEPRESAVLIQTDYNSLIASLDAIMLTMMTKFGKTEDEAAAWLEDFIKLHYFAVWRKIAA